MIFKRLALGIVGVVSATIMISAATHAVDFENSTIEDGDGRFVIAGIAGVVFLVCLYFLVSNLATARWTRLLTEAIYTDPPESDGSSPVPQLEVTSPSTRLTPRPSSLPVSARLGATPPTVTEPDGADAGQGRSLFGATPDSAIPKSVSGLFGLTPPSEPSAPAKPTWPAPEAVIPEPAAEPEAVVAEPEPEPVETPEAAPIVLRDYHPDDIGRTVHDHHAAADSSVASGTLRSESPPTAADIRTMLFIAPSPEPLRSPLQETRDEEPAAAFAAPSESPPADPMGARLDELPRWQVVIAPDDDGSGGDRSGDDGSGGDGSGDDEPPSTGRLYATGG